MFYKRIFASNLLAWPLVVLVVLYPVFLHGLVGLFVFADSHEQVIAIIVMLTGCKPMSYIWEVSFRARSTRARRLRNRSQQYSDPNAVGECVNLQKFYFGNGIWAASIDLVLLLGVFHTPSTLQPLLI